MKKTLITILILVLTVSIGSQIANAIGSLTPSGTIGDDTQYSLNDIYNKLVNFSATPNATSSPFTTPGSAVASFRTLTEIYNLLSAENPDIISTNIATGTSIFGVNGTLSTTTSLEWASGQHVDEVVDWFEATTFCNGLSEGGDTDWRLPTISELLSGYISGNPGNTLGFNFTDGTATYWSSTVAYDDPANVYTFLKNAGTDLDYVIQATGKDAIDYAARAKCVRLQ